MTRATSDEWDKYYEAARVRRRERGGDPLDRLIKRHAAQQRVFFLGSTVFIAALVFVCYQMLVH